MLTFDPARHEYRFNGKVVPGTTSILQAVQDFSMVPTEILLAAQWRGTAVHKMTELYDADDLDEEGLSDEMRPYLAAYKQFRAECNFTPLTREQPLYHPTMRYCGTPDLSGMVRARLAVIDIKSMFTPGSPVIGLQLAAYKELHCINGHAVQDRYALHLRNDGTYRLHPYKDSGDLAVFFSLLNVKNWREHHGI